MIHDQGTTMLAHLTWAWQAAQRDPMEAACYVVSALSLVGSVVLIVKTVRLQRQIRAVLNARAEQRNRPSSSP